ncbi:MAG: ABC transporter permease [Vicinamibacterales bacterium]
MTPAGRTPRLAGACYGALLRVYPSAYRQRFAADMCDTFLHDLSRVRRRGWVALIPFWIVTIAQAVWFGSAERRSSGAPMPDPTPSPRFRFSLLTDVRYALRLLARSPLFAVTSIASLGVGLAAATVIFGLADALLFKTTPGVRDSARVVDIGRSSNGEGFDNMSYPLFRHLREHTTTLEGMAATTPGGSPVSLAESESSERIYGQLVSTTYFDVLGVRPALGRLFVSDDDAVAGARPVAVLTYTFWQERFQGDSSVLQRPVRLNGHMFDIVGVAEAGFGGSTMLGTDIWVPAAMVGAIRGERGDVLLNNPRAVWHTAVGRLRDGVSIDAAQAELNALTTAFRQTTPELPAHHGIAVSATGRVPPALRLPFTAFVGMLFVLTGGLLAVACSNVAGMLMARATARRREIATRLAIGAGRGQIVAQLVTETVVLFGLAVVVAAPLALWLMAVLQSYVPALPVPLELDLAMDVRALGFATAMALLTGAVFGLIPARHALRTDLTAALHGQASTAARDRVRTRHALVVVQVALSLTMIITATLFVRTLMAAATIDPGFVTTRVDVISVETQLARAEGQNAVALIARVMERLQTIGGVEAIGHSRMVPLQGGGLGLGGVRVPGLDDHTSGLLNNANWDVVSPGYFDVLQMPIVEGRAFTGDDREGQLLVTIVNETFARAAWPGESAVGKQFWQTAGQEDEGRPLRVVGVARDAKYRMVSEAQQPFIYVPFAQQPDSVVSLYVRHAEGRRALPELRQAIAGVEPNLPVVLMQSLDEATAIGLLPQRIAAWVAGSVGVLGLLLAALGLYGLTAFLVAQRTREIAIRMALGATSGQVRGLVLRRAARLGVIGGVIGIVTAIGLGMVVQSLGLLINARPTDPVSLAGLVGLFAVVLFVASDLPARRAARTDPALTLKAE